MHDEMLNGWVVVRLDPWDFRGPFPTRAIAEQVAAHLNAKRHEYDVKWGERPASKLRDSELAFWKGDANDAKGRAIRSGVHGRSNDRKPKTRTGKYCGIRIGLLLFAKEYRRQVLTCGR